MNKPLNGIPIIIHHKHNRVQLELEQIRKRLHSEVQAALTRDEDAALVLPTAALAHGFECSESSSSGVADAAEDGLVAHGGAGRELGVCETVASYGRLGA